MDPSLVSKPYTFLKLSKDQAIKIYRMLSFLNIYANERRHGAIFAFADYIDPWSVVAISACLNACFFFLW